VLAERGDVGLLEVSQTFLPSTIENGDWVAWTRSSFSPAAANSLPYSVAVRSFPGEEHQHVHVAHPELRVELLPSTAVLGPRRLDEHAGNATVVMRCDSVRGAVLAIGQGVGIGAIPCYLAAGEPSLRRLTPEVTANAEIYLVTAPDVQALKRVRLVLEMLTAVFERHRALFA